MAYYENEAGEPKMDEAQLASSRLANSAAPVTLLNIRFNPHSSYW